MTTATKWHGSGNACYGWKRVCDNKSRAVNEITKQFNEIFLPRLQSIGGCEWQHPQAMVSAETSAETKTNI